MWRELRLGLCAEGEAAEGWRRVLRQEKLPCDVCDGPDRPVILFDGKPPSWCADHVERGGIAVVTGAAGASDLFGEATAGTIHRFRPPGSEREAVLPCLARLYQGQGGGEIRLHENRKSKSGGLADVRPAVLVRPHGRGWLIYTGLPLASHLAAAGDSLRAFAEGFAITERVASVDKADLVDTMVFMLREAFAKANLPYLRLARFPDAARSIFLFRVDVDGLWGERCRALAEVASAHGIAGSFYFNASLCGQSPGDLDPAWLADHEIGNHSDVHDLFDGVEANHANLVAGLDWIEKHLGQRPRGYVAPRGLWNPALDRAMAALGHVYSSDFGLDIDSLPFFTPAGVLQVPVHPFSPERLTLFCEDAGLGRPGPRTVLDHYRSALERQVALGRPAHLYGHPEVLGAMAETVLPKLFAEVARLGLPSMTVGAYAQWWIARDGADFRILTDGQGAVAVETTGEAVEAVSSKAVTVRLDGAAHAIQPGSWTTLPRSFG